MTVSLLEASSGRAVAKAQPQADNAPVRKADGPRKNGGFLRKALIFAFFLPTLAAGVYYGFVAAPRYEAQTQFIVRGIHGNRLAPGLASLMQAVGIGRSSDDSNVVLEYLGSRDAVTQLETALPLREIYGRQEADPLSRFPRPFSSASFERLYWYFGDRVQALEDPDSGIITVKAQAFRAEDAQAIARQLLTQAETLVNVMNARLEADTVSAAETAVADATKTVMEAHDEVTRFRNAETVVDPTQNAVAQLSTIADLSGQVDQVLAQISQNGRLSPANPGVASLKAKADALNAQIAQEQKGLAGPHSAVADKVSSYERLIVLRELADQSLAAATASLQAARADARRQHIYVELISAPNLPDEAMQPERIRAVATVFAVSAAAFAVLWLLSVGVREHGQ